MGKKSERMSSHKENLSICKLNDGETGGIGWKMENSNGEKSERTSFSNSSHKGKSFHFAN